MLSFVLDQNLGLPACDEPWKSILSAAGVVAHQATDLTVIDRALSEHQPDLASAPFFHEM